MTLHLAPSPAGTLLRVRVIPRAHRNELAGSRGGALVVRLAAPPVEGAANDALIEFLAHTFGLPRRSIRLIAGERSRDKRVEIAGMTPAELDVCLQGAWRNAARTSGT